jgi:hypothetical protein
MDIELFALILLELVFGRPPQGEASNPASIPNFACRMIESGLSATSTSNHSFNAILKIRKSNDFAIEDGVDSAEVSSFVSCVESAEQVEKQTE